jgi:hypothetical protein
MQYVARRKPASEGQVRNLAVQVEKQKGEIKQLKSTQVVKAPKRRRRRKKKGTRNFEDQPSLKNLFSTQSNTYMGARGTGTYFSSVNRKNKGYDLLWNEYLNAVMDPKIKDVIIPDLLMFPFTTLQSKTVITVTTATSGATADGTFALAMSPSMSNLALGLDGKTQTTNAVYSTSGLTFGQGKAQDYCPATVYDKIVDPLDPTNVSAYGWRPVSMGAYVRYIGPPLSASGRICVACVPKPWDEDGLLALEDFETLSAYNYSSVYQAVEGCTQVWLPMGPLCRQVKSFFDAGWKYQAFPFIIILGEGLPGGARVLEVDVFVNYEIFSTSQVFTASRTRIANTAKLDHAVSTGSAVFARNGGSHAGSESDSHTPWWKTALSIGKDVAEIALPLLALAI